MKKVSGLERNKPKIWRTFQGNARNKNASYTYAFRSITSSKIRNPSPKCSVTFSTLNTLFSTCHRQTH